jgi:hypothetical protein
MLNQASGVLEAHHGPAGRAVDLSGAVREPLGRGRYSGARLDFVFRSHIVSESASMPRVGLRILERGADG